MLLTATLIAAKRSPELFDVALADLAWGLLVAAFIGVVGGFVYATLTNPPPDVPLEDAGKEKEPELGNE
jgi:hypothetical protein